MIGALRSSLLFRLTDDVPSKVRFVVERLLCTCHRLAAGVGPRANQGDCKMGGAKLGISPRGGGI